MKIKYLAQGGSSLPVFVSYNPVVVTGGTETDADVVTLDSKKSGSSDSDLTDKDLLKMLDKLDGLPSDMAVIT